MESKIEIIEKEMGNVIEIEEFYPVWKIPLIIKKDLNQILDYLKSQNCECNEAPYTRYLDIDWEAETTNSPLINFIRIFTKKWHFQVGMPTSKKLDGEETLKSKILNKKKYVHTIHQGPYQKVGQTYKNMYAWIKNKKIDVGDESIEIYLNDPRITKKDDLETSVLIPIN